MADKGTNDGAPEPKDGADDAGTPKGKTEDATGAKRPKGGEPETFTQAEVDRIMGDLRDKERKARDAEVEVRVEGEKERLRKEAETAKLLEDENYKELAERSANEAKADREKLTAYERTREVNALLDKRAEDFPLLKEPKARELFGKIQGELPDVAAAVDALQAVYEKAVQDGVDKRLDTGSPPPSGKKPVPELSHGDKIKEAEGKGEWEKSFALKGEILARAAPVSQADAVVEALSS